MLPIRSSAVPIVLGTCSAAILILAGCAGEQARESDASAPPAAQATTTPPATQVADAASPQVASGIPQVTVYKSPTCGCCAEWVDHLRENGFAVVVHDQDNLTMVKAANGITPALESCHTALVDGYVVEGHVPADLIAKLITEKPDIAGLAVPGMPGGSPGMESAPKEPYDVLAIGKDGRTSVFARR